MITSTVPPSEIYLASLVRVRLATAAFRQVQFDYRIRKIEDAEYISAREEYQREEALFDYAFRCEENRIASVLSGTTAHDYENERLQDIERGA